MSNASRSMIPASQHWHTPDWHFEKIGKEMEVEDKARMLGVVGRMAAQEVPDLTSIDWASEPGGPKDVGNPPAQDERSADWDNARSDFNWRYRAIGNQQPLIGIIRDTPIWSVAEQLLGAGKLIEPEVGAPWREDRTAGQQSERVRGVICNLPRPAGTRRPSVANGAHVDSQPFQCGLVVYVDDVPPGGGGFTIWPRSHLRLYRADRRFGDVVSAYNPPPLGKGSFIDDLM